MGVLKPSIDVRRSQSERVWFSAMEVPPEMPDTPERQRLRLLLELGSPTGLGHSEVATTQLKGFRRELVDGQQAWLLDVIGRGGQLQTGIVFNEIKALLEQHHQDMDAAGLGFDARVDRAQGPNSLPATAAGVRMTETGPGLDGAIADAGGRHCRTLCGKSTGTLGGLSWASSGALPSRRDLDRLGVPFSDHQQQPQADCYGALERSAIYKVLRRFFREVTVTAASCEEAPGSAEFLSASTHWLGHTFANSAVR